MHTITLTVMDAVGLTSTDTVVVTVQDTTAPNVSVAFEPTVPPTEHGPQDEEFFVCVSVGDACHPAPVLDSFELVGLDSAGVEHRIPVVDGVKVRIRMDENFDVDVAVGADLVNNEFAVRLRGPSIRLEARATDSSGNIGTGTAIPVFSS